VGERKGTAAWTVQKYSERGKHLLCHPSLMRILWVRMYNQYYCSVYGLQYAYKMSGYMSKIYNQCIIPALGLIFRIACNLAELALQMWVHAQTVYSCLYKILKKNQ
jgi:hypothetical protein